MCIVKILWCQLMEFQTSIATVCIIKFRDDNKMGLVRVGVNASLPCLTLVSSKSYLPGDGSLVCDIKPTPIWFEIRLNLKLKLKFKIYKCMKMSMVEIEHTTTPPSLPTCLKLILFSNKLIYII